LTESKNSKFAAKIIATILALLKNKENPLNTKCNSQIEIPISDYLRRFPHLSSQKEQKKNKELKYSEVNPCHC